MVKQLYTQQFPRLWTGKQTNFSDIFRPYDILVFLDDLATRQLTAALINKDKVESVRVVVIGKYADEVTAIIERKRVVHCVLDIWTGRRVPSPVLGSALLFNLAESRVENSLIVTVI